MKSRIVSFTARNWGRTQEDILKTLESKLASLEKTAPDLVCFPEEVLISTGDRDNPASDANNAAALELARQYAAKLHTNLVVSLEEPSKAYPGKRYNTSCVIDRAGNVIGCYRKRYITFRAVQTGGLPGSKVVTVDTDIGKIGLAVCFDIGWREGWAELERQGAQLVVWPAAYHGGNLLNAYAAVHGYAIVTSVWSAESRVINSFGDTAAESSAWNDCVTAELDLGAEMFHFDHHTGVPEKLRAVYGDRVSVEIEPRGNLFTVSSNDPSLTVADVKKRFGLITYREYHEQSAAENAALLREYPEMED